VVSRVAGDRRGAANRRRTAADRLGPVALGLALDAALGEPPARLHPVAGYGAAMNRLQDWCYRDRRRTGALYAAAGLGFAAGVARMAELGMGPGPALVAATALSAAGRELTRSAAQIGDHLARGDTDAARALLPVLVGRDPGGLNEGEIARAVVESLAENLSDAVVSTAFWGVAAGAPGAIAHRAANTLDAMVGHRSRRYRRFGLASARLDDAMGWPGARLTAVLVAMARPRAATAVYTTVRRHAPAHPSPNAGVAEAAFAAALGLRLGGTNRYGARVEVRPFVGAGRPAEPADIQRAVALARDVIVLLVVVCAVGSAARWVGGRQARGARGADR
jgi:adenosylcobinamide-phosphate synthase